jgi:hypothetical protein
VDTIKRNNYKEWLEWREEHFKESSRMLNEKGPTEEQQMEAWGEYLKETDSGHRPC